MDQPECVTAGGGNSTIINGNEAEPLARVVSETAVVIAPGGAENETFINPAFREAGF